MAWESLATQEPLEDTATLAGVLGSFRPWERSSLDLGDAFSRIGQEFLTHSQMQFRVIVVGTAKPLRSAISNEIYLAGHEALSNAFRHSGATDIEIEVEYTASHLRVLIRDNGTGIDPRALYSRHEAFGGLCWMKERMERTGGRLRVLSSAAAGTEVELLVPAHVAFESPSGHGSVRWLSKLYS